MPPRRSKRKADAVDDGNEDTTSAAATAGGASGSTRQSSSDKKTKAKKKAPPRKQLKPKSTSTTTTDDLDSKLPPSIDVDEELPTINITQTSLLSNLLIQIQSLSKSKVRCSGALQSLIDGRVAYTTLDGVQDEEWEELLSGKGVGSKKKSKKKASDYALNLAAYAASLSGEDALVNSEVTTASKGKKRSAEKKGKPKGGDAAIDNSDDDNHQGSNDAHLIMAVTQAINVLLSYLKEEKINKSTTSVDDGKKPAAKKKKWQQPNNEPEDTSKDHEAMKKQAAIILISLSNPLMTTLVNDRTMLETITKASRASSSSPRGTSPTRASVAAASGSFLEVDSGDEMHSSSKTSRSSSASPTRGGLHSPANKGANLEIKRVIMSHAKAVVGRALTSGVMGALWGLETLCSTCDDLNEDTTMVDEDDKKMGAAGSGEESSFNVEHAVLRKCLWSALMTFETSFQLTSKPKLLVTSSVTSPVGVSGLRTSSVGGGIPSSSGRIGSALGGMDFDKFLSSIMMGTSFTTGSSSSSSSSGVSAGHAHLTMGSATIAMWNEMLSRILVDYRVEFLYLSKNTGEGGESAAVANAEGQAVNDHLAQVCHVVTNSLFADEGQSKLISLVLDEHDKKVEDATGSSSEPPKKARRTTSSATAGRTRKGGKQGGSASSDHGENYSELSALLSSRIENHITFDCHVSIRRWAALAFGWLCDGQKLCLDMGTKLLTKCEGWEKIMELPSIVQLAPTDVAQSSTGAKKKKKKVSKSTKRPPSLDLHTDPVNNNTKGIPGNLALIIFVSCMVDMIYDAGSIGGLSPPAGGWMDEYTKAIVGIASDDEAEKSKPKSADTKKKKVGKATTTASKVDEAPSRRSSRKRSKTSKSSTTTTDQQATTNSPASPRGSPASSKKSPSVWVRPDIRDETAVLTKCLMESHFKCLNNTSLVSGKRALLVNDDDTFNSSSASSSSSQRSITTTSTSSYYPFMHRTLDTLGRTVASSSFHASSDGKSKITSIGSAVVLGYFWRSYHSSIQANPLNDGRVVVLDTKLLSLAISKLSECLQGVMSGTRANSTSLSLANSSQPVTATTIPQSILTAYHMNEVLDISMSNAKKAVSTSATSTTSSYGGAFRTQDDQKSTTSASFRSASSSLSTNCADNLSLFVRALASPLRSGNNKPIYHDAMSSLIQTLLAIVSICYDFDPETNSPGEMESTSPTGSKKKSSSKKKKRKVSSELTSVLETPSGQEDTNARKTYVRCVLASDALQALIQSLAIPPPQNSETASATNYDTAAKAALAIQSHLRMCVTTETVLDFVKLGYVLENKLIHPRLSLVSTEYTTAASSSSTEDTASSTNRPVYISSKLSSMLDVSKTFELCERQLWVCHIQLALTLGRGGFFTIASTSQSSSARSSSAASMIPPLSCLNDANSRLQIFQAIVEAEKTSSQSTNKSDNSKDLWPLCLPAQQHALIASMLLSSQQGQAPEVEFLCNSFLNSLEASNSLAKASPTSVGTLTISDCVSLSLRDARLFALATTRLPINTQRGILSRLITILNSGLESGDNTNNKLMSCSHFVGRALSLCASLVDVVACSDLHKLLRDEVEKTNYSISRLKQQSTTSSTKSSTLISKDVFQSLFENWSSPSVPAATISTTQMILENSGASGNTDQLLLFSTILSALNMGVSTCASDGCHLLFSAWNAAGKLSSWTSKSSPGPVKLSDAIEMSSMERIVRLREDMSEIYQLMGTSSQSAGQADTLLLKVMFTKSSNYSSQPSAALFAGLDCANQLLAHLAKTLPLNSTDVSTFAYYEALPLYISFLMSVQTRPGSNDMSLTHRLQKISTTSSSRANHQGGSSSSNSSRNGIAQQFVEESDIDTRDTGGGHSSTGGSGSIVRINALTRLHEACSSLGAAPCHPDWLDTQCKLHRSIGPSVATNKAQAALSSLTNFGLAVWKQYFQSMLSLLSALDTSSDDDSMEVDGKMSKAERYSLAIQLYHAQAQNPSHLTDSFFKHVSTVCKVDLSLYKLLINTVTNDDQKNVGGAALATTSPQLILGANYHKQQKVFGGEHRANQQWETLLTDILRGTSLSIPSSTIADALDKPSVDAAKQVTNALTHYHHWRRVLNSVINAMVPTTALLRFGINAGRGRNVHPQCDDSPGSIFSSGASASQSRVYSENSLVSTTIQKALSFLSCVGAYMNNDKDIQLTSRAASNHLLDDSSSHVNDWISMWSTKILCEAMEGVVSIINCEEKKNTAGSSASEKAVVEQLCLTATALVDTSLTLFSDSAEDYDDELNVPIISVHDTVDCEKRNMLLACLGLKNQMMTTLIGNSTEYELVDLLLKFDNDNIDPLSRKNGAGWKSMKADVPKLFLSLLSQSKVDRVRIFIAEMLLDLFDGEVEVQREENYTLEGGNSSKSSSSGELSVCSLVAASLDKLSKDDVLLLVKNLTHSTTDNDEEILSERTAIVLSYLAGGSAASSSKQGDGKSSQEEGCKIVLTEMLSSLDSWAGSSGNDQAIKLLCLLGARFGALDDIGTSIVSLLKTEKRKNKKQKKGGNDKGEDDKRQTHVDTAREFFKFVASLDRLVNHEAAVNPVLASSSSRTVAAASTTNQNSNSSMITLKSGEQIPRTCSFVETGEGFTEQHWYNCYTCGLLWDKGCCSLCARVCHKGHDVGYSRKSSFFCDCGAEVATAIAEGRTPCKCLTPVAEDAIQEVFGENNNNNVDLVTQETHQNYPECVFTDLLAKNCKVDCQASLKSLVDEASKKEWKESILTFFNECYQTTTPNTTIDYSKLFATSASEATIETGIDLEPRSGTPLAIKRLNQTSMFAIRAARSSALQSRMVTTPGGSSRTSKNAVHVQTITADNRGRLYIAESSTVTFFSAIPVVNVRYMNNSTSSHLSRSQLNTLGSGGIHFSISGMAICRENNRHLLLWGVSKACIAIISKKFDKFERIIELKLNLEPSEEYLVKCEWLPQSEYHIVAVCGTVVHVFDLKRAENDICHSTTHYALAYEDVLIRSATLIGSLSAEDDCLVETRLALLLDTGRLFFLSLAVDGDGNLEEHGESYIETGQGYQFPTTGIRRYSDSSPASLGATSSTFGEGTYVAYLEQSNLLLYQCTSSCCVAFLLDSDGSIFGSFELLPNVISADTIGGHYGIQGPFTHFQELGTVKRGTESLYKLSCVGKSTRSNQPRSIVLEFNEKSVSVKELQWPASSSSGLGFVSSYNFVGSCTFSCPYLVGGKASEGRITDTTTIDERAFMTLMSSSGSLLFWGEDCPGSRNHYTPSTLIKPPEIGYYEKLINATQDSLVFGGEFVGSTNPETIKRKLSLNSSDYAMSPSSSCTLTCTLEDDSLAIVAVRVLVGSMPELIPREMIVMGSGRKLLPKRNTKRWYDFPLTDEETLLALRNGFITIWISSCHDTASTPIIDSVECYARPRSELDYLKKDGDDKKANDDVLPKLTASLSTQGQPPCDLLVPCIQSLSNLTKSMGQNNMTSLSSGSKETISQIIQQTALDASVKKGELRDQTIDFLNKAEGDEASRALLVDEATLRGLMSKLKGIDQYLCSEYVDLDYVSAKQETTINCALEMLLHILYSGIAIARVRGDNYRNVITQMIADKTCERSMALLGKKVLDFCQNELKDGLGASLNLSHLAKFVSELILFEIAACPAGDSDSNNNFAQFDTLAEYLVIDSPEITKSCCSAISSVIGSNSGDSSDESGDDKSAEKESTPTVSGTITYQCDSCLTFPITERRYTLGGEMDVDLCKNCYDIGMAYSRSHNSNAPVIINGQTLTVENEDMTCGEIRQMMSKPIAISLEQAENAKRAGLHNAITGSANKELAMKSNSSGIQSMDIDKLGSSTIEGGEVPTEGFRSSIFTQLLGLITKSLDTESSKDNVSSSPISSQLIVLLLDLVLSAPSEELKSARGKEMALALTKNLPSLVQVCISSETSFSEHCSKIVRVLHTLSGLVLQKKVLHRGPPLIEDEKEHPRALHHHKSDKTDPRFICDVHGAPAVRRRCSHGIHKDRRFYVCGLEKSKRCNYFKWSDNVPELPPTADNTKSQTGGVVNQIVSRTDANNIFVPVQIELEKIFSNELQQQWCSLVSNQFEKNQSIVTSPHDEGQKASSDATFPSAKTEAEKEHDAEDGVYKSMEKFGRSTPLLTESDHDDFDLAETTESFLCSSLDLFSLLASKRSSSRDKADTPAWSSDWFSVLCEIISTGASPMLRQLAKSMLQRLCGDRQEVYLRVRDHYVFGFRFRKLLQSSQDILESALVVREQARQCGSSWRDEEVMFESLPASGLLGVEDLISEDWYSVSTEESISTVLDELITAAKRGVGTKARSNSWRNFCGLTSMSFFNKKKTEGIAGEEDLEMLEQIYHRSPMVSLLWLCSCLQGSNQIKALTLANIALEELHSNSAVKFQDNDKDEVDLLGTSQPSNPEQCLMESFAVDDLLSFIKQFVLNGRSKDVRSISSSVAKKISLRLSSQDKQILFSCLVSGPFQHIGTLGTSSNAFCDLLRGFVDSFGSELDLSNISSSIAASFISQMTVLNHYYGQNQGLMSKHETEVGGPSCNLSNCVSCQKQTPPKKTKSSAAVVAASNSAAGTFLPDQVRPYQRSRLEASSAAEVSSEFSSYHQLKFRVALSQVHVTVTDPRGRLVKTIGIYFSPRQVNDASVLKSTKYTHLWQRCGTLSLARGATEATCLLNSPVIAANLKFTYEEFYEKASNKRAADGSFILYCPRCTRQVHNAHGVCGNCGEVAFQCRKCRHINYDRLDAFLCVECGYCTAGAFSYELTAGIALNAIAILDEDGFQRSMAMLQIANKRQTELRNSLKKKVTLAIDSQRKLRGDQVENLDEMVLYGPQLNRALMGFMPKAEGTDDDEPPSSKKKSKSLAGRESSSSSNRARSLLSLARSLRADGGDASSRNDILRQALMSVGGGPSGASGLDLDESDILSALGASSSSNDPLSRVVANMQSRSARASSSRTGGGGDGGGGGKKDDKTKLSSIEERSRLQTQMREAERECYELNRRIDAWNRLNKDCLSGSTNMQASLNTVRPFAFTPSTCTSCSMQMAYQILSLLHAMYVTNISQSEHTVTIDLLRFLLKESESLTPKLKELKRRVIITLASTSNVASKIVLTELRARLGAVQDVTSAEILGRIIELDFPSVNDYIQLAVDTLSSS